MSILYAGTTMPDFWNTALDRLSALNVRTLDVWGLTLNIAVFMVVVGIFILGFLAVRGPGVPAKITSVIGSIAISVCVVVAVMLQLSWPQQLTPRGQRALSDDKAGVRVLHVEVRAPTRIYLVLDVKNIPRNFWIPWSEKAEEEAREAQGENGPEGKEKGKKGKNSMYFRFEPSEDKTEMPRFYAIPHQAPPSKDETGPQPFEFKQPEMLGPKKPEQDI